jgi:hypothetical protein
MNTLKTLTGLAAGLALFVVVAIGFDAATAPTPPAADPNIPPAVDWTQYPDGTKARIDAYSCYQLMAKFVEAEEALAVDAMEYINWVGWSQSCHGFEDPSK